VNCGSCHGASGQGDGAVAKYFRDNPAAPVPPTDLTSARVRSLSDGAIYWIVANGLGNMPAFGDDLTDQRLWTAVVAIKDLQQQAG
jgi:mono/diheme cytochrome c family protein